MKTTTSRIIIETMVRKAIRDIKDSPERSSRNLVDMALQFATGRFQQHLFSAAQTMLQNEHSPYYGLIKDVVTHVDTDRILSFCMNLGYNSCTMGAKTIRKLEETEKFNIPWNLHLNLSSVFFKENRTRYQDLISQGENLGIFTWMLFYEDYYYGYLSLAKEHPDSAFVLFIDHTDITASFMEDLLEINNIMLAVRYSEDAASTCSMLREAKVPYSVYFVYHEKDLASILDGELFCIAEQLHPVFTALLAAPDCPPEVRKSVYEHISSARKEHLYQTIPWETVSDSDFVDSIISNEACQAGFDSNGDFVTMTEYERIAGQNIFHKDLKDILKDIYPKKTEV